MLTKVVDLFDTVIFVISNKYIEITFLHVYHHAFMRDVVCTKFRPVCSLGLYGIYELPCALNHVHLLRNGIGIRIHSISLADEVFNYVSIGKYLHTFPEYNLVIAWVRKLAQVK